MVTDEIFVKDENMENIQEYLGYAFGGCEYLVLMGYLDNEFYVEVFHVNDINNIGEVLQECCDDIFAHGYKYKQTGEIAHIFDNNLELKLMEWDIYEV